jgi:hypothetical protein
MNLMDKVHIDRLELAYEELYKNAIYTRTELPENRGGTNRPIRELDRAVIEALHTLMKDNPDDFTPYDTVRGLYIEGDPIYPGAGPHRETHIQICVRNINCIKCYFDPRTESPNPFIV